LWLKVCLKNKIGNTLTQAQTTAKTTTTIVPTTSKIPISNPVVVEKDEQDVYQEKFKLV